MPPPDAAAINALGRRLARHSPPLQEDVDQLGQVEARYVPALEAVSAVVRNVLGDPPSYEGVPVTVASRPLKTIDTIIEKLQREHTRLSTMRDIAGIRIVGDGGLTRGQQDRLAARIAAQFPSSAEIVDRRLHPSFGYRALHLVVEVEGYPVEIQIRTDLQHGWADGMERLGDIWGRQIRYGSAPSASNGPELERRSNLITAWKGWGDLVESFETTWTRVEEAKDVLDALTESASQGTDVPQAELDAALAKYNELYDEAQERVTAVKTEIDRIRGELEQGG